MNDPCGPTRLIGRTRDFKLIRSHLDGLAGAVLLLSGEAGMGKTALLEEVAAHLRHEGARVLWAGGVQFETDIGYAGLNQLLLPLFDSFDRLDPVHRDALRVAVGIGAGPPPSRLLTSTAVLLLLRTVAEDTPLCLVVDDLPWLDRATVSVLGFVARRLVGSRIGFLAASRTGTDSFFESSGLTEHRLPPLDDASSAALLNHRCPRCLRRPGAASPRRLAETRWPWSNCPPRWTTISASRARPCPPCCPSAGASRSCSPHVCTTCPRPHGSCSCSRPWTARVTSPPSRRRRAGPASSTSNPPSAPAWYGSRTYPGG
ncbi:AAA family ATPase [Streptomyces viridiviolaceus]